MKTIFIKPAPGIKLFDPETNKFIPADGMKVKKTQYWSRRVAEGGAVIVSIGNEKPAPEPAPEPAPGPAPDPEPAETEPPDKTKKKKGKKKK